MSLPYPIIEPPQGNIRTSLIRDAFWSTQGSVRQRLKHYQSLTVDYDAISLSPMPASPPSFHTTVFPVSDATILSTAEKLIAQLKARHYYTDTATFDLKCGTCGVGLKGEKGARDHAMQTGRESFCVSPLIIDVDFGEY